MSRAPPDAPPPCARSSTAHRRGAWSHPGDCSSARPRLSSRHPSPAPSVIWALFELVLDLVEAGPGASIIEVTPWGAGGADCANNLVTHLDHDAAAEQKQMRQFEKVY